MPRTWKEDEKFRKKARGGEIKWQHILSRPNNRKPDSKIDRYYRAPGDYMTSKGYRLYWIRSSQKVEQDQETRARRIQKTLDAINELQPKLNKYKLKTRLQIDAKLRAILRETQCLDFIVFEIHEHRECKKIYRKRGRPSTDKSGRMTWKQIFSISFEVKTDAISQEEKVDGVFPLITNLPPNKYKAKRVLEIYKFQPFLEKRHTQIKTYQEITPVNLKKAERVVGIGNIKHLLPMIHGFHEVK